MLGTPYSTARPEAPDPTTGTRDRSGGRPRLPGQARASVTRRECNGAVGMLAGLDAALWSSAGRRVGHRLAGRLTPISAYVDPISSKAANDASRISTLRHGVETAAVSSRGRKNRASSIVSLQKASKSSGSATVGRYSTSSSRVRSVLANRSTSHARERSPTGRAHCLRDP
jgi:hypothetical protein